MTREDLIEAILESVSTRSRGALKDTLVPGGMPFHKGRKGALLRQLYRRELADLPSRRRQELPVSDRLNRHDWKRLAKQYGEVPGRG